MPPAILEYLIKVPLKLIYNLFVWATAWFWAGYSVAAGVDVLPGVLRYLHTIDDTLDGGQHQLGWEKAKGFKLWMQRTYWMIRNPASGLIMLTSFLPASKTKLVFDKGHNLDGTKWDDGIFKYRYTVLETDEGKQYFGFRSDIPLIGKFWLKVWFGWQWYEKPDKFGDLSGYPMRFSFQPRTVKK